MRMRERLVSREFLSRPAERVARELLGCVLVREIDGQRVAGRIVETEAYLGVKDAGAHSFGGRRTPRVEAMYMQAGTAYVYFTYGMHYCMNVVCGAVDEPVAVLIRALEPTEGVDAMRVRRKNAKRERDLCSGPAKLCQAMGIGPELNKHDLLAGREMWLEVGEALPAKMVAKAARIGLGTESVWKTKPLRFLERGNPHVSVGVS
ncbi:MAG TPA: DNA-3-methyladenine glycosylase [Phycisphaerales bacterium]|nr:DNA-3-methyladenine glycosylase [Phycisphaerales bacterium]